MRDRETIDSELRKLAAEHRSMRGQGSQPSSRQLDELLDERLGHLAETSETGAVEGRDTGVLADTRSRSHDVDAVVPYPRTGLLRNLGLFAALPLSLIAVAAALVVIFTVHQPTPAAEPAEPAQPSAVPPPSPQPKVAAPKTPDPLPDVVDIALINALKHDGVPVPSSDYVVAHGHAVCDFLAHQPVYTDAVGFVQRSTIWDAAQSAQFTSGAIVSYCPQYEVAGAAQMQQDLQNALAGLQAIQGDLQGIRDDLPGIGNGLPADPGQP